MKELSESITNFIDHNDDKTTPAGELGEAAVRLSTWLLRNCTGDLLRRGLKVCEALAEFDAGLVHPQTLKD